jgi:predicted aspartyl protease
LARLIGSIDLLGRPLVRMQSRQDDVLVLLDTGFNGELLVTAEAAAMFGIDRKLGDTKIELGDGRLSVVRDCFSWIEWLGERRLVRMLISSSWMPHVDSPQGLLGTGLLNPHLMLLDFAKRTIEIESQF